MFETLTDKFQRAFSKLMGDHKLTEGNITDAIREIRFALLEADVNYGVAKEFVRRVKEKSLGLEAVKTVSPGQQFIKIIHDELVVLMGGDEASLALDRKLSTIMLCGLQGSGKTTQCAKLAMFLKKEERCLHPLMVACDLQRPAAVEQLRTLGEQIAVPVFAIDGEKDPKKVAKAALAYAKEAGHDLVIVDTAGRLHIDEQMMEQLEKIKAVIDPDEVLFVANAGMGQDAVNAAAAFNERVKMTGTILTMLDGNVRGGAAVSIGEVTGKPLKFEGVGEKIEDIQIFNPRSMADRILGMGDTINLVKKAQQHVDEEEAKKLERKVKRATFCYDDYLKQMKMFKRMGPLQSLLKMLPGMRGMDFSGLDEGSLAKVEAIILSMTPQERMEQCDLTMGRRKRIAYGSGTAIDQVDRLIKSFKQAKQLVKNMSKMKNFEEIVGGALWH